MADRREYVDLSFHEIHVKMVKWRLIVFENCIFSGKNTKESCTGKAIGMLRSSRTLKRRKWVKNIIFDCVQSLLLTHSDTPFTEFHLLKYNINECFVRLDRLPCSTIASTKNRYRFSLYFKHHILEFLNIYKIYTHCR